MSLLRPDPSWKPLLQENIDKVSAAYNRTTTKLKMTSTQPE